jgi:hypothetical protein
VSGPTYAFFDPGISLIAMRDLPVVREKRLIFSQDWYDKYDWAQFADAPQERHVRIHVPSSFNKSFEEQAALLQPDEEVCSVRIVSMFLVINALATSNRLLSDCYVRCANVDSVGHRVVVGNFGSYGFHVYSYWVGHRFDFVGVAAVRKS